MNHGPRSRATFVWPVVVIVFVTGRIWLHEYITSALDQDSYKYLGGADALMHGGPLPPLFNDLPVTGGALHAVPGYAWFISAVWQALGTVSISSILFCQSLLALVGNLAACSLVQRTIGPWTAIAVFSALTLSPSIAWLEHTVMPDVLAPQLLFLSVWLAAAGVRGGKSGLVASALLAGAIAGAQILLRTASQVYLPIPLVVAALAWKRIPASLAWLIFYVAGIILVISPWVVDNHRRHGVYDVSHSIGRNLYFSGLWTNTIDRSKELRRLGISGPANVMASFRISDFVFRTHLKSGKTVAEADDAMRDRAISAYRQSSFPNLARQRFKVLMALFEPDPEMGGTVRPMRQNSGHYLSKHWLGMTLQVWAQDRFQYRFSPALRESLKDARRSHAGAVKLVRRWMHEFTLEGLPLLYLFLVATLLLFALRIWLIVFAFAAPVAAFLAAFLLVGTPLWRYQAALHPFMVVVIVTALSATLQKLMKLMRLRQDLGSTSDTTSKKARK